MVDVLTPKQRSGCMSRIRGRDTKPEVALRRALWGSGLRYRLTNKLPGKPDILFISRKVAVFVDGCFWHRCPLHYQAPMSRSVFWREKIAANVKRDRAVDQKLAADGWTVVRVWEHELREDIGAVVGRVMTGLGRKPKNVKPARRRSMQRREKQA